MDNTETLDAALGDRYVSEFFGVRPEVLVTLYVERGLWDRFLARDGFGRSLNEIKISAGRQSSYDACGGNSRNNW